MLSFSFTCTWYYATERNWSLQPFWTVAQTKPFCERKAQRFLTEQGFESYLPLVQNTKIIRHKKQKRISALFSRYIFVRIIDHWHSVRSTIGISNIVLERGAPALIKEEIISDLKKRENNKGFIELQKKEKFKKGQKVRVLSGRFTGYLALYDGMSRKQRERVLLSMLGRYVPAELTIGSCIEAVR